MSNENNEGISLENEVKRSRGANYLNTFSAANFDLKQIELICTIGSGSFADVYLVRKEEEPCAKTGTRFFHYYAMKVVSKKLLREKDYQSYIKFEKTLTQKLKHPLILRLHYSF